MSDFLFIATAVALPTWLVVRAWRRYLLLDRSSISDLLQMKIGLFFISVAFGLLLTVPFISIVDSVPQLHEPVDHFIEQVFTPTFYLVYGPACIGGIVCSRFRRKRAQESLPLRKAIGLASGVMLLPWIVLAINPH